MNRAECLERNQNQITNLQVNEKFHDEVFAHGQRHGGGGMHNISKTHENARGVQGHSEPIDLECPDLWASAASAVAKPMMEEAKQFGKVASEDLGNLMHTMDSDPFVHHVKHDICQDDPVREAVVIGIPALTVGALSVPFDTTVGGACAVGAFGLTVFGGIPMTIENMMRSK